MSGRVIKFRFWNIHHKEMFTPDWKTPGDPCDLAVASDGLVYTLDSEPYAQETGDYVVMQFTGLLDKNGKEIYEGDIIAERSYLGNKRRGEFVNPAVVKFGDFGVSTDPGSGDEMVTGWFMDSGDDFEENLPYDLDKEWEVIGNIWENPELLTETK